MTSGKIFAGEFCKADQSLGLLFGWAIICKINDRDYFDLQDDHVPEMSMLKAASRFMTGTRALKVMHDGESIGQVVFAMPLTSELADALSIRTKQTGLIVGVKPDSPTILAAYKRGELKGFSIGGRRIADREVA